MFDFFALGTTADVVMPPLTAVAVTHELDLRIQEFTNFLSLYAKKVSNATAMRFSLPRKLRIATVQLCNHSTVVI